MQPDPPLPANMWRFSQAPFEFRELFPEARDWDWIAHVPQSQRQALEPMLLRWNEVYPIHSAVLPDQSVVYCGAPRQALALLAKHGHSVPESDFNSAFNNGQERRTAVRVRLVCPSRYETHTEPKQIGMGHTIDMSNSGIAFTTESRLPTNATLTLHLKWPVRLPGEVPVELRAVGRLARTETLKAALQLHSVTFDVAR
jgi:hypothetical protein